MTDNIPPKDLDADNALELLQQFADYYYEVREKLGKPELADEEEEEILTIATNLNARYGSGELSVAVVNFLSVLWEKFGDFHHPPWYNRKMLEEYYDMVERFIIKSYYTCPW